MRGKVLVICPTAQGHRVRHVGATGRLRIVSMREGPVGQDRLRSMIKGGRVFGKQDVSAEPGGEAGARTQKPAGRPARKGGKGPDSAQMRHGTERRGCAMNGLRGVILIRGGNLRPAVRFKWAPTSAWAAGPVSNHTAPANNDIP